MRQKIRHQAPQAERLATRRRLIAEGRHPYPPALHPTHSLGELRGLYGKLPPDTSTGDTVVLVGRVMSHRAHGGVGFVDLRDGSGDIQLLLTDGAPQSPAVYTGWQADVDPGDQVSITGEVITSRTGALTVRVTGWKLAAKALRPLPGAGSARPGPDSAGAGGQAGGDQVASYRRMMVDPREAARTKGRAAVLRALRDALHQAAYLEADTPLLHALPGGTARPFHTWMNAWHTPLYLRGNTELYLKRLVVGGAERVFELGRVFRNEGAGVHHHPEFTVCEGYAAHTDYHDSADLVEQLVRAAAGAVRDTEGPTRVTSAVLSAAQDPRVDRLAGGADTAGARVDGFAGGAHPSGPRGSRLAGGEYATTPRADRMSGGEYVTGPPAADPSGGPTEVRAGSRAPGRPAPFARITLHQLLSAHLGEPVTSATEATTLLRHARRHGLDAGDDATAPALALLLFRKLIRPRLTRPTFVLDFPTRAARFAHPRAGDPTLVEAWTLVLAGTDVGQGCTELTDPVEQRRRMTEQRREPGLEHLPLDEEFLTAVEHGLPPLGGFSLGVDRLLGALRDDGRRLSDQQCLGLERAGTLPATRTGRTNDLAQPPHPGADFGPGTGQVDVPGRVTVRATDLTAS